MAKNRDKHGRFASNPAEMGAGYKYGSQTASHPHWRALPRSQSLYVIADKAHHSAKFSTEQNLKDKRRAGGELRNIKKRAGDEAVKRPQGDDKVTPRKKGG